MLTATNRKSKIKNQKFHGRSVSGAAENPARGGRVGGGLGGRGVRSVASRGGRGAARERRPLPPLPQDARHLRARRDLAQAARTDESAASVPTELSARSGARHIRRVPR